MFDVVMYFRKDDMIERIIWSNPQLEKNIGAAWELYVGRTLTSLPGFSFEEDRRRMFWKEEEFRYSWIFREEESWLFLEKEDHKLMFLSAALDVFEESIQIYDRNAMAVHFNKATEPLIHMSPEKAENRHLMELFHVDESYSTTLTGIRTKERVKDRFDKYQTQDGVQLTTINNSWPVFAQDRFMGVISVEMDEKMVDEQLRRYTEIREAMDRNVKTLGEPAHFRFEDLVCESRKMQETITAAKTAAGSDGSVLLFGGPGSGKYALAQCIHQAGNRASSDMVYLNCTAVPDDRMEEVLFGQNTDVPGNEAKRRGVLDQGDGGTLYLKEVSALSMRVQSLLLGVLQDKSFTRPGTEETIPVDVRVMAGTTKNMEELVREGRFRVDLYYQLSTIPIRLPSLTERPEDIEGLIWKRIRENEATGKYLHTFQAVRGDTLACMKKYSWPGNIRELNGCVDYAMTVASESEWKPEDLPPALTGKSRRVEYADGYEGDTLNEALLKFEESYIRKALEKHDGNISRAAQALGIKRQNLQYRMKKLGMHKTV